jgi:hypothetical protein
MLFYDYSNILNKLPDTGWFDTTYGNDTCPSFSKYFEEWDVFLRVTADYPDKAEREIENERFEVSVYSAWINKDNHSESYDVHEIDEYLATLYRCEELDDLLNFLNDYINLDNLINEINGSTLLWL